MPPTLQFSVTYRLLISKEENLIAFTWKAKFHVKLENRYFFKTKRQRSVAPTILNKWRNLMMLTQLSKIKVKRFHNCSFIFRSFSRPRGGLLQWIINCHSIFVLLSLIFESSSICFVPEKLRCFAGMHPYWENLPYLSFLVRCWFKVSVKFRAVVSVLLIFFSSVTCAVPWS